MDLILFVCIINSIVLSFLYVQFQRFMKKTTKEEGRILSCTKKQADMIADSVHRQEGELDEALADSRRKMIAVFERQTEKNALRIQHELEVQMKTFTQSVFSRIDSHVAESLAAIDQELSDHKKQKIAMMDENVQEQIKKAAKTALVRGISISVHEKIVEAAIKEAISEING